MNNFRAEHLAAKRFFRPSWMLALGTLCTSCVPLYADVTRIEAEAVPVAGDLQILSMPEASGGKAVSLPRDWNPIFNAVPPQKGDAFTIWVRYQGKPLLLKSSRKDGQKDLAWQWDSPKELTWKRAGRWTREQLGDSLLIIRGGDGGTGPILDCVVFATDDSYDPNIDQTKTPSPQVAAPVAGQPNAGHSDAKDAAGITEGAAVALGMQDTPRGLFFEAEAYKAQSNSRIEEAMGASGRQAVHSDADWQPLVSIPLPVGDGWKVWVRHKGGPFAIKTKTGDRWFWNKPENWSWTETDVFSREELGGQQFVLMRGSGGAQADSPSVDAVVLAPEKKRELPADKPDPNAPPQKVAATIDWNKSAGTLPVMLWGINEQQVLVPERASDSGYQKMLGELHTPLIRIHQGDLVASWSDKAKRDWDIEKIKAGFAASSGYGTAKVMLCINTVPEWIAGGDATKMTAADEDAFAAFCARLVQIMRDDVKRPIDYWEITNELDNNFERAGRLDQLWRIYNKCAAAMRKVDAKAKLGGPAFTWANPKWVDGFLDNCQDVQFISWHNYGTGDLYESNEKIFAGVSSNIGALAQGVLNSLKKHGRANLETFLTETNVKYTWDPYERRHQNQVGSIFHALVVRKMAELGITGVTIWTQTGSAYGSILDGSGNRLPSYLLYQWGTKYLSGKLVATTTGDSDLVLIPVINSSGQKSVLVLNKSEHTFILPSAKTLLPGIKTARQINAQGVQDSLATPDAELAVPGYSLSLLSTSAS